MILQIGIIKNPLEIVGGTGDGTRGIENTNGGLINFGSNIIRLLIVVAGIYALLNFVMAGLAYITSEGDAQKLEAARSKITNSILGLVIVAASFILAAVAGILLFGNAGVFLAPQIFSPDV